MSKVSKMPKVPKIEETQQTLHFQLLSPLPELCYSSS
jgi:hypothetical protein